MPSTIFYAWQSDRDQKICHYSIRDAANDAIKRLLSDASLEDAPSFEVRLEHDRLGIPGHPDIAKTIKEGTERECADRTGAGDAIRSVYTVDLGHQPSFALHKIVCFRISRRISFAPSSDLAYLKASVH